MDAYTLAKFEKNLSDISAIRDYMWHGLCILVLITTNLGGDMAALKGNISEKDNKPPPRAFAHDNRQPCH